MLCAPFGTWSAHVVEFGPVCVEDRVPQILQCGHCRNLARISRLVSRKTMAEVSIVRAAVLHQIEDQLVGNYAHSIPPNLPQIQRESTTMS